MTDDLRRIGIAQSAWDGLVARAGADAALETGGILLGWRRSDGIHVAQIIEVHDHTAGHARYRRRHAPAEAALAAAFERPEADSPIGYVGEWHSHPAPVGPSFLDRCELRRISGKTSEEVALLVGAYSSGAHRWTPMGLTARRRRIRRARVELVATDTDQGEKL